MNQSFVHTARPLTDLLVCHLFPIFAPSSNWGHTFYPFLTFLIVILFLMAISGFTESDEKVMMEELHINFKRSHVQAKLVALKYIDKETKQHIFFLPSLQVSGYGKTAEKAVEMAKFHIHDYFTHLATLQPKAIKAELSALGWKKGMFNKDFSKVYVDGNGILQNLNAVDNKVETVTLTAA